MEFHSPFRPDPKLTDHERRRRVVRLCCSFMRNLAFHRAGMQGDVQRSLLTASHPRGAFWREVHANFFDICVLEWCKLFVDRNRQEWGEHHWRRVVDDTDRFEAALYASLKMTAGDFANLATEIRHYRDKFVAHLDGERMMYPPVLEVPKCSVTFLFEHLSHHAHGNTDWQGLPTAAEQLVFGYEQSSCEAESVYAEALSSPSA